jgi:hypothetical protein
MRLTDWIKNRREREDQREVDRRLKYLMVNASVNEALKMVKGMLALCVSDLEIEPEITEREPALIGKYRAVEDVIPALMAKVTEADRLYNKAADIAEKERALQRGGTS